MEKKAQDPLSEDKYEATLQACVGYILRELDKNKPSPVAETELFRGLSSVMQKSLTGASPESSPLVFLGMAIEGLTTIIAPVVVAIASIPPGHLQRISEISEDDADLLRRGLEDYMLEMVIVALKHKVLVEHLRYKEFQVKLNKDKK